jgi:hypothetical protein
VGRPATTDRQRQCLPLSLRRRPGGGGGHRPHARRDSAASRTNQHIYMHVSAAARAIATFVSRFR